MVDAIIILILGMKLGQSEIRFWDQGLTANKQRAGVRTQAMAVLLSLCPGPRGWQVLFQESASKLKNITNYTGFCVSSAPDPNI